MNALANPFRFGTVVDGIYFTDREKEIKQIGSYLRGANHLIIISPRRFGKTSLIKKILGETGSRYIYLDLQLVVSEEDFASQLLKRIYRIFPFQKLRGKIRSFRIIPTVMIHPVTGETEISFKPGSKDLTPLEDVLQLIEKLGTEKDRIKVVLDEFQEIFRINPGLDRMLRSIMQNHKNINYIFMGSSESMLREIFEKKNSAFYRFGSLYLLGKIPEVKFRDFLLERFGLMTDKAEILSRDVLKITGSHPYYTQQLAFNVWELLKTTGFQSGMVETAADGIIRNHDNDYERLWHTFNRTDRLVLTGMALSTLSPLSEEFRGQFGAGAPSTVFSSLQRLTSRGILIKENASYQMDDPFFRRWIISRRQQ
ncbi:MAG: AAA family ATPase [Bacteroidales bacterium]